jgi:biotin synthase
MGMEVCCTLGMLDEEQAKALKNAGLTAYNHNLDTSREFYPKVRYINQSIFNMYIYPSLI